MGEAVILTVEDDSAISQMLACVLEEDGYEVLQASGYDAMQIALAKKPDLILLDIMMPGIDGFTVLQQVRSEPKLMHIPIIMVTGLSAQEYLLRAFDLFVNDYVLKPFSPPELLARIKTQLHHSRSSTLSPLTHLPGGRQVEAAITQKLQSHQPWALIYLDLDHFKALNDAYGFWRGNEMIRIFMRSIVKSVEDCGTPNDFIGHIGGEDFVVITVPDRVHSICRDIIKRFQQDQDTFYRADDIQQGGFWAVGRDGNKQFFPLVSVSIAVLLSQYLKGSQTFADISERIALLKTMSKQCMGSCYVIEGETSPFTLDEAM